MTTPIAKMVEVEDCSALWDLLIAYPLYWVDNLQKERTMQTGRD